MVTFTYRIAVPSDHSRILKFLSDYFYHEETYTRSINAPIDRVSPFFEKLTEDCLKLPYSIIVTEAKPDTNSGSDLIVAVLLNSIWKREDVSKSSGASDNQGEKVENKLTFGETLQRCHVDFWNMAPPEINMVMHREVSSVGTPWQRQGIASKMSQIILNLSRKTAGVGGITSATTSLTNQKVLAKQGFTVLKEYPYSEMVDSEGKALRIDDGTKVVQLNFRPLS